MMDHHEYWFRFTFRFVLQPLVITVIAFILSFFTHYSWNIFLGLLIGSITVNLIFCLPDTLDYVSFLKYRHRCKKFNSQTNQ